MPVIPLPSQIPERSRFGAGADLRSCAGGMIGRPQPSRPGSVGAGDFGLSVCEFAKGTKINAAIRNPGVTNRLNMVQTFFGFAFPFFATGFMASARLPASLPWRD